MDTQQNILGVYNKYAQQYFDKFSKMNLYNDTYDAWCESVKTVDARILEIGCGPGNVTSYMLSKRPDFQIEGIDLAPKMVELAKANNPTADYRVMACQDILSLQSTFDAIMCAFCIPYISKEEVSMLIADCAQMINGDGNFYISAMIDDYSRSGLEKGSFTGADELYIYYHEEAHLKNELATNGFEIEQTFTKDYPESDGSFTTEMIFLCRKGIL